MAKLNEEIFARVLAHVNELAAAKGINGLFGMQALNGRVVYWDYVNGRDWLIRTGVPGKDDVNAYGVLMQKMACVVARHEPSGLGFAGHIGEYKWRGAIPAEDCAFGFTGGTQDQDVEICEKAAEYFAALTAGQS